MTVSVLIIVFDSWCGTLRANMCYTDACRLFRIEHSSCSQEEPLA